MSRDAGNLKLYLPLSEVEDGLLPDLSGDGLNATLSPGGSLLPDDAFGAVVRLDGATGVCTVPDSPLIDFTAGQDFTVELWVSADARQTNTQQPYTSIVEKWDGVSGFPYAVRFVYATGLVTAQRYDQTPNNPTLTSTSRVDDRDHHHVAFVRRGGALFLYIDGAQQATAPDGATGTTTNAAPFTLGAQGGKNFFAGELAHVRVYDRGLSEDEIREDMRLDLSSVAAYARSHPVGFDLYNGAGLTVLVIDASPAGRQLTLEVQNISGSALTLLPLATGPVSADNAHFGLLFRPGTLSPASVLAMTTATPGWAMSPPATLAGGVVVVYLGAAAGLPLPVGGSVSVRLESVSAAPGGARETRVELAYQKLAYQGEQTQLSGTLLGLLAIVNDIDPLPAPLAASFEAGSTVLNDGTTQSTLLLRLTNISGLESITLSPAGGPDPSRLVLTFDTADDFTVAPYALGTRSQVGNIVVTCQGVTVPVSLQGPVPTWTFVPETEVVLAEGQSLVLQLSHIVSSAPSGTSYAYIAYENFAQHNDSSLVAAIEKGPLVVQGQAVGIGTTSPQAALHVAAGNVLAQGFATPGNVTAGGSVGVGTTTPAAALHVAAGNVAVTGPGSVGIGTTTPAAALHVAAGNVAVTSGSVGVGTAAPQAPLHVAGPASAPATGGALILGPTSSSNLRLGFTVDYSWLQSQGQKPLVVNPTGNNVGVGLTAPQAPLHVAGVAGDANGGSVIVGPTTGANLRLGFAPNYSWVQSHGSKPLAVNPVGNNVGIGTSTPSEMLEVGGTAKVQSLKIGKWTLRADGDDLVLVSGKNKTIRLTADGLVQDAGAAVLRTGDNVYVTQVADNGGTRSYLNGTTSGDSSHGSQFVQWTYWRQTVDGDSNLRITKR